MISVNPLNPPIKKSFYKIQESFGFYNEYNNWWQQLQLNVLGEGIVHNQFKGTDLTYLFSWVYDARGKVTKQR